MEIAGRQERASRLLAGYVSGPAAATHATAVALMKAERARAVVLVEGISDQIALGAGSQRKLRYALLLVEAVDDDRVPRPLDAVLAYV